MSHEPKDPAGNHFPEFHDQGKTVEALKIVMTDLQLRVSKHESRGTAIIDRLLAIETDQRAVFEALTDYFNGFSSSAGHRVLMTLRETNWLRGYKSSRSLK